MFTFLFTLLAAFSGQNYYILNSLYEAGRFKETAGYRAASQIKWEPCKITPEPLTIIHHGPRNKKEIALTFDADMTPAMKNRLTKGMVKSWYDKKIIDILEKTKTPATIFVTGIWAETYRTQLQKIAANPLFEIGNHSYSHPSFNGSCYGLKIAAASEKRDEILKSQQILVKEIDKPVLLFRFPGGCSSQDDMELLKQYGLVAIDWDVVGGDSFNDNGPLIKKQILEGAQNGSIIVLHLNGGPNAPRTSDELEDIIRILKKKGFAFVTVSQLIDYPHVCEI